MANQHGGYRKPSKPAAVSGPGALSRRTDGGVKNQDLPDARYGEQSRFQEDQAGAKMGASAPSAMATTFPTAPAPQGPPPELTPLGAPTARPDEPITAGAALGPGIGPDALGITPAALATQDIEKLRSYLPAFVEMANREDATPSFRNFVRMLRAKAV